MPLPVIPVTVAHFAGGVVVGWVARDVTPVIKARVHLYREKRAKRKDLEKEYQDNPTKAKKAPF